MKKISGSLYVQVVIAIAIGILIGCLYPAFAMELKVLGDIFIRLIKMLIAPIIFCTIVTGIAHVKNTHKIGRVGLKAIIYFEIITTIALLIGLLIINVMAPGKGLHIQSAQLDTSSISTYVAQSKTGNSWQDFTLNIIPESIVKSFADNQLLQVLLLSILLGLAMIKAGEKAQPLIKAIQSLEDTLFMALKFIMKLAPLGAFGAMAFTIGKYGIGSIAQLGQLLLAFYITCLLFIVIVLGSILRICGFNIFKLLIFIKEELLIVLGTSSSESALPGLIDKLKKIGCGESVVGLVVPAGYSFNLDGTCIYLSMAGVFLAQATDTPLDLAHQFLLLGVLLITSKGAAGVTGSGFITLAATLPAVGHIPVAAIAIILGIDRFMSEGRALTNIIGNAVATIVVSKWEKDLDEAVAIKTIGTQKN